MADRGPDKARLASPGASVDDPAVEAQRALLARPSISIRTRISAVFVLLFVLLVGITISAVFLLLELSTKQQFVEKASNFTFEIQQARRFEKNFFLYGTNLSDALANIQTAHNYLDRDAEEMRAVVGVTKYESMMQSLLRYEQLLERLLDRKAGPADQAAEATDLRRIEADLRKHGAVLVSDAQEVIDRERMTMHSMMHTAMVVAISYLAFMFFVMAYAAGLLIRAVLRPLGRFVRYTARIGAGDYSPILPTRKYRDEFSNLAIAINQMLHELTVRQDQLLQSGKMAAVGTLTSGIAHELNNPLNNISLTTEALLDGFDDTPDEDKRRMLQQVATQVERASSTVRNLLDFTRKPQAVFTRLSIAEILDSSVKLIHNELELGGVELELNLPADLPEVPGNPRSLQQVFLNLLLNSVQAMPDGGRLTIGARPEGDQLRVDVQDTGMGIQPEDLEKVFEPFFTTKDPGQGTGLGLSVTYGIVEKHGGKITVDSRPGEGTRVSVFLPLKRDEQDRRDANR